MISCIAIDDEPIALEIIQVHAKKVPFLSLKATFLDPVKALQFLQQEKIDLVFLDIRMPGLSGMELAKAIDKKTGVIFTTAFTDYAIAGFELGVVDYLLKPIGFERFLQACLRAEEQLQLPAGENQKSIFIKDGYEWVKIALGELLYIEANDNYVIFREANRKLMSRMTLSEAEEKLPADIFVRVHKSYIINISKVEKVENHQVTINGHAIPLSSTYRNEFIRNIKQMR